MNEITPESRSALADDIIAMAVATPLRQLCQELISLMAARAISTGTGDAGADISAVRYHLPEIYETDGILS